MNQPSRILLIKPSSFGDIIHGLPVLAACKARWPDAEIDWAVKPQWAELLVGHPLLRRIVFFPGTAVQALRSFSALRRECYDMVIDLQGLLRSALFGWSTGCPLRIGFDDGREGSVSFYTRRIKVSKGAVHAVDRCLDLARQIEANPAPRPEFPLPESARERDWLDGLWTRHGIREGEPVCVVHPSARQEPKRWPAERFARLADALIVREGARVITVGAGAAADRIEPVVRLMGQPGIDLTGKTTLLQLAALLRRSNLLVTNDSGPMHLAAAVGTPVVAIFGPTDPARVGPYGAGHVALRKEIDCSPCSRRVCRRGALCMKAVDVGEVTDAARAILNGSKRKFPAAGAAEPS